MKQRLEEMVLSILNEEKPKEIQKMYYLLIKKRIAKKVNTYFPYEDYRELERIAEDITQDFFLWLLRENTKKNFTGRRERLTAGYLLKKINNLIIDYLRKVDTLRKHIPESLDKHIYNHKEGEDQKRTLEDNIAQEMFLLEEIDWKTTAAAFLNTLEKRLKEEHIRTLCHWIFRDKYSVDCFLENLSPSAKYKRVERLKKTLKEILEENPLELEEWKAFVDIMETYCQKRFGKCV